MAAWFFLPFLALFLRGCPARPPTYAHPQVQVECGPHRMVVTVHRDLFGLGKLVAPTELALGAAACPPSRLEAAAGTVVFQVGLHECGSVVQMSPDFLAYQTQLFYKPSLATHPVIARSRGATIRLECRYPRKDNVSSQGLRPTWVPFESTASREAKLGFSLRLMNDDWTAERASDRFLLGEPLRLQAEVRAEEHPPLRLWVEGCRAGLTPRPTSGPQYDVLGASGCLLDGRIEGVSSAFLAPRPRPETLRFTVDAFRFTEEAQKLIYITCRLKVTPAEQPPDALNKACSFDAASHSWVPVEGPSVICSCCETQSCGGAVEGPDPQDSENGETAWQRSLTVVETAGPEVALALGPLFVLDPQRGNGAQPPGEPAEEEMAMEELIPAVSKITHPPFREQWGSSKVPGDPKDHLGLSLEAFVQQGPIFFTGAEGGSGFGDPTETVTGSVLRKQAMVSLPQRATALASTLTPARQSKGHFSATERSALAVSEGLPSPLEDTVASTAAKLPKEALNMAAKDGKQVPGWLLLLLLPTGAAVVALLSLGVWLLVRRRRCGGLPRASPVSLELQCK